MKFVPSLSILPGFLFALDIDYPHEKSVEELICLADVNDACDLVRVFDAVLKPEFFGYSNSDKKWLINTIAYYLEGDESFVDVFEKRSFLFSDDISDTRGFMSVLLGCLLSYQNESGEARNL